MKFSGSGTMTESINKREHVNFLHLYKVLLLCTLVINNTINLGWHYLVKSDRIGPALFFARLRSQSLWWSASKNKGYHVLSAEDTVWSNAPATIMFTEIPPSSSFNIPPRSPSVVDPLLWIRIELFISFLYFFWQATVCWPLLCLCRPFCIFERGLDSNPESCRSKQERYQLSHPSP